MVGVPKTIDNDLAATDFTFGFQTAVQIATDAIDRLHTTAESHNRVIVVEVMGRDAGWIAAYAGMAGGADVILVPERPFDIEEVCNHVRRRHARGRTFSIVVVSEGAIPAGGHAYGRGGATDAFGHERLGGIAVQLEAEIEQRTGFECRMTILGHVQRGGSPLAFDRVLGTRFGVAAIDAATAGHYGKMVALRGTEIELVPLEAALDEPKLLDPAFFETAEVFFGDDRPARSPPGAVLHRDPPGGRRGARAARRAVHRPRAGQPGPPAAARGDRGRARGDAAHRRPDGARLPAVPGDAGAARGDRRALPQRPRGVARSRTRRSPWSPGRRPGSCS